MSDNMQRGFHTVRAENGVIIRSASAESSYVTDRFVFNDINDYCKFVRQWFKDTEDEE